MAVRTRTIRRLLGLKKAEPLIYRGLAVKCIGSKKWREENQYAKEPEEA